DIRNGKAVDVPGTKVLRGYNLVREFGCFGCHEIAGFKNGREVGPDLRLEPSPPLEEMTPLEREKMLADPTNPPGTMRKIGPSLRRLSEKTNQTWVRRWLASPRSFRPDTKMPHFYGLSNNRPEALPEEQKDFPDAEIHSIAYYLLHESQAYLAGQDTFLLAIRDRKQELERRRADKLLSEQEQKELEEVDRRLEIARKPIPIRTELFDSEGAQVQLPGLPADEAGRKEQIHRGRQLFSE